MKFQLERITRENVDIQTFWFKPDARLRYEAGQFVEVHLPHVYPDERGINRWFTLSSSPTEKLISLTTRNFHDKASSFKKALFELKPGGQISASEAMGDFVLPKDKKRPLLFVAGGIGITPMRSMAKFLLDSQESRHISLLHAVRSDHDLLFTDLFKELGINIIPIISSQPGMPRLSAQLILDYSHKDSLIYISGPEPMTEQLVNDLKNRDVEEHRLVTDYFPGYEDEYSVVNV